MAKTGKKAASADTSTPVEETAAHKQIQVILEEAFGKELISSNSFRMSKDGEEIFYTVGSYDRLNEPVRYLIGNHGRKLEEITAFYETLKESSKRFLLYRLDPSDGLEEFLFSYEIVDFTPTSQTDLLRAGDVKAIQASSEDIIRIPRGNKGYTVAIRIGPEGKRDYTALKHYLVSSDNRTYNKVVRNLTEYIEVTTGHPLPANTPDLPNNLLVSGAPGTGKSHFLDVQVKKAGGLGKDESGNPEIKPDSIIAALADKARKDLPEASEDVIIINAAKEYCDCYVTRVTFYEDYSYENFIGCYKPVPDQSKAQVLFDGKTGEVSEKKISYEYIPGPFIEVFMKAMKDKAHNYFLIIEEINRAKAACVFGDMFQLLDRKDGISEYEIKPESQLDIFLSSKLGDEYHGFMKLPDNMFIWATMNSADQAVLPLDSAFKRRWAQIYMDINSSSDSSFKIEKLHKQDEVTGEDAGEGTVLWDNFRKCINEVILANGFDEDRCIGPWYFSSEEFAQINKYFASAEEDRINKDGINMVNPLIDKLIYYLRQDVFRRNPGLMFRDETKEKPGTSMSDLRRRIRQNEPIEKILNIENLNWVTT